VAVDAALPAVHRTLPLTRALTARVGLTLIVLGSFVLRVVASAAHPVPRYFPDEYLYTAISRALATGHLPAVRGSAAHFPALLAPLLAAPLQALFSPETAYRLTQMENALLMSLAAVPIYLLARRLSLSAGYALACAAFALLIPDLVYASYTLADPVAYPFALGAIAAGVAALEHPTRRRQLLFLALALLATFARVQYIVLPAAFVVAAFVVDRRRALRAQRLILTVFGVPLLAALALGPSHILGYYSRVVHLHVGGQLFRWGATDLMLLAFASGVVLIPGAIAALVRPHGRTETAFATFTAVLTAGLLLEAALYASNGSDRFQERYLFALLPLVPVAFGLYLKHGRPFRVPVALLSAGLLLLSARVPLSGYAEALGKTDSPFLSAVFRLERMVGTANGSLVIAALVAVGALGAFAVSRGANARFAVGGALAFATLASLGAIVNDASNSHEIRHDYLPDNPSWVDASGLNNVTLVQTVGSPPERAVEQLYWNRSIVHEARLGDALPTDVYAAPRIHVAADGTLGNVRGNVLVQDYAATVRFQNATLVAQAGTFSLWSSPSAPKLSLLEQGRYSDGWLAHSGRVAVWPDATGRVRGLLRFALMLPTGSQAVTIRFGKMPYRVVPGRLTTVVYTIDARGPWSLAFKAVRGRYLEDLRAVSVKSTPPTFERAGSPSAPDNIPA